MRSIFMCVYFLLLIVPILTLSIDGTNQVFDPLFAKYSRYIYDDNIQARFSSVLFIIKYNFQPTMTQIIQIHDIWKHIFIHQVASVPIHYMHIDGLQKKINENISFNNSRNGTLNVISSFGQEENDHLDVGGQGYTAYTSLIHAMKQFPDFQGYLFTHDDMVMNITQLKALNLESVWVSDWPGEAVKFQVFSEEQWKLRNYKWPWLNVKGGISALDEIYNHYPQMKEFITSCSKSSTHRIVYTGQSDFIYIPREEKETALKVLSIFAEYSLFLEIAVPMYINCFVAPATIQRISLCTYFRHERYNLTHYQTYCGYDKALYHPVKFIKTLNSESILFSKYIAGFISNENYLNELEYLKNKPK